MSQPQSNKQRRAFAALRDGVCFVLLAVFVFALHHESLDYGLFMDDYAHYQQLRECDWSVRPIRSSTTRRAVCTVSL